MDAVIHDAERRMKVLLMVSRFGHCLNDLLYRWKIGALPIDIVGVVSNHFDYQKVVVNHDIPFHYIRVTKENKPQAEAQLLDLVEPDGHRADRAGALHAGSVGRHVPEDVGPHHQHPPLLPAVASRVQTPTSRPTSAA